ncbi:MAG: peptidoglycan editing factor PgeF [Tepidimonas sp.]|uniref:peptidoglycan editing factor PgeF n=1 Tax=Tepidimonas sp. TaxID=2002775 RepID=UPI00259EB930|nr:peptidoglycan editing factor PgeF [Tepidimonas sp.]MDM7456479.1 peptidoglycan editing factor PgeF [Tepidimonas sp.]
MSTRVGGVSGGPWASLNLGDHVGDAPAAVACNRQRWAQALGVRPIFLRQVHGAAVVQLDRTTPDGIEADACWTDAFGLACTVLVADCLPILMAAADGRSVAAAHAGWRGLVGRDGYGVLEALCAQWPAAQDPERRHSIRVWIGAAIGPQAFEVGDDVRDAFAAACPSDVEAFCPSHQTPGRWLADLPGLARRRLARLGFGLVKGNDGTPAWCTVGNPSRFFSHRRDAGFLGSSGRLAAAIWRA